MTRAALLVLALGLAVGLRSAIGGDDVAQSQPAALVFGLCLSVLAVAAGTRVAVSRRAVLIGLAGIALVCFPVALEHLLTFRPVHDTQGFVTWALVVTVVATAEEVFLRGALYDAVAGWHGEALAIAVGAVCFALLHVPMYGWHVVPLDLAVGIVLGGLRQQAGTPLAPAITHLGADLVGWFLR